MKKIYLLMICLGLLVGCSSAPTSFSTSIMPDQDDRLGGTGLESDDLRSAARKMATSLLDVPEIANAANGIPKIALLPVKNNSRFIIDKEIFTKKIRIELNSNAQGKMRFLARDRMDNLMQERQAKREGVVSSSKDAQLMGVDYFLTGDISAISKASGGDRSDYILLSFQLIDAETSEIVWENAYEVKKVGHSGVVYQ